jgi:hypothetical protein
LKLFRFYPADYVRQYALAEDLQDLLSKEKDLFIEYILYSYSYPNPCDSDDMETIAEYLPRFVRGLGEAESQNMTFIDNHY